MARELVRSDRDLEVIRWLLPQLWRSLRCLNSFRLRKAILWLIKFEDRLDQCVPIWEQLSENNDIKLLLSQKSVNARLKGQKPKFG